MTYTIKLTEKQIDAIYSAINIHSLSYEGYTEEELVDYGVKKALLSLRQVEAKLDAATERVEA